MSEGWKGGLSNPERRKDFGRDHLERAVALWRLIGIAVDLKALPPKLAIRSAKAIQDGGKRAPTSCSTSWPGSASRRRRRASRRPKACGFATSRWPIVGATTA